MKSCYITSINEYSKFNIFLLKVFGCMKILKKNTIINNNFYIIRLPVIKKMKNSQRKRYYEKINRYLKKINVNNLCIYNINDYLLVKYLNKNFNVFDGKNVLLDTFNDILKFFSKKKCYNLNECEIVFISNNPKDVKNYILKCFKKVKNISIFTTNPGIFKNLTDEFREKYGMYIKISEKKAEKKYNKIYINCEKNRIVKEDTFQAVNIIDIYNIYKGSFINVIFAYKTKYDKFFKENNIVKNLTFTEYYINCVYNIANKKAIYEFMKEKNYKIVNIRKK